jgi:ribulose-phosphate 3-epimerase
MCVKPGKGGQKFIPETLERLRTLNSYRLNENLVFNIEVDGGINPDTLKPIRKHIDDITVGSYVCESKNYDEQINNLKKIK